MKLLSILFPQTVFKTTSKFSGEIKVIDHVFERRLVVGELTQSGGILGSMWRKALNEVRIKRYEVRGEKVLILGLGAGTVAEIIDKKWPDVEIVGVEIDPVIIDIGKKYFDLQSLKHLEIVIVDAIDYVNEILKQVQDDNKNKFDIVIVDLYKGFIMEKNVQTEEFLRKLAGLLSKNGLVIFNVLAPRTSNSEAKDFLDKLHRIYKDYFCRRIISNDFFFCTNPLTKGGDLSMAKKKKRKKR